MEATIDLGEKLVYWKMNDTLLAKAKIPENLWSSIFYLAVIIGDTKD